MSLEASILVYFYFRVPLNVIPIQNYTMINLNAFSLLGKIV